MSGKPDGEALQNILHPQPPESQLPELPEPELDDAALEDIEVDLPEDQDVGGQPPPQPDYERDARAMGWHPREEYLGPPGRWVDAKTFIERGQNILPVLRENNRKLIERVERQTDDIREMRAMLNDMRQRASQADAAGYQRALAELKKRQREAVRDADTQAYDEVQTQITEVERNLRQVDVPPPPPPGPQIAPEVTAFVKANPWYNNDRVLNQAMQAEHVRIAEEMPELSLADNLELAADMVKQRFPQKFGGRLPNANGGQPPSPQSQTPPSQQRRQAPSVATPTGGARPAPRPGRSPIDQIEDASERAMARDAYTRMRRHMPDYTEAEYMAIFSDPKADILNVRASIREKRK